MTGGLSAFAVVPGPGLLNAGAALTSGYWSNARALAVVGQIPTSACSAGAGGVLHELPDQTAVLRQVTKRAELLVDPAAVAGQIQAAMDAVVSGRPRPVSIEVPADRWSSAAEPTLVDPVPARPTLDGDAVERAAAARRGAWPSGR